MPTMRVVGRLAVLSLTVLVLSCGCGSHRSTADRTIDAATGHIGPLRPHHSDREDVIASAGRPEADWRWHGTGSAQRASGYPAYRALGYDCARNTAPTRLLPPDSYPEAHLPACRTIFFVNLRTGTLMSFLTTDPSYRESHGVRVGMPTAVAERHLHRRVFAIGCNYADISLGGIGPKSTLLLIQFTGGVAKPPHYKLVGGHVADFHVDTLGLFDCG
jgi:hypothetical protein